MWKLEPSDDYARDHRRYEKKRPRELVAVTDNLDTFFETLKGGAKLPQIKFGFIHPEPQGVLAIDQKGGGKSLAQTRLYIFPDPKTQVIHLIALGDKGSQSQDLQTCRNFMQELRQKETEHHEQEQALQ